MNNEELVQASMLFKAMADPNRLRILAELMKGDTCNCELKDNLGLAANLLSHHLKTLEKAGLVGSRRDALDGRWIYYAIDRENITHWREWVFAFFDPAQIQDRPLCGPEGQCEVGSENLASVVVT